MMGLRQRLRHLGPWIGALFALWIVAPRKALVYHTHRGGEHQHVHPEEDDAWLAALFDELQHRHHHGHGHHHRRNEHHQHGHHHGSSYASGTGDYHGPVVRADDPDAGGHWHQPHSVYRAVISGSPHVLAAAPLEPVTERPPPHCLGLAALDLHARGPPVSTLFS